MTKSIRLSRVPLGALCVYSKSPSSSMQAGRPTSIIYVLDRQTSDAINNSAPGRINIPESSCSIKVFFLLDRQHRNVGCRNLHRMSHLKMQETESGLSPYLFILLILSLSFLVPVVFFSVSPMHQTTALRGFCASVLVLI